MEGLDFSELVVLGALVSRKDGQPISPEDKPIIEAFLELKNQEAEDQGIDPKDADFSHPDYEVELVPVASVTFISMSF